MEGVSMLVMKPKIVVFAGPNGSGKSTVTDHCVIAGEYINADAIQKYTQCSAMDAAVEAERLRESALLSGIDFTFETVLSTERNLNLLQRAKQKGYFIRGYYVLTCTADINVVRVKARVALGGHDVPEDKIRQRYDRAMQLIPRFVDVCDVCSIYDNSGEVPTRIFKKSKTDSIISENEFWSKDAIKKLVNK